VRTVTFEFTILKRSSFAVLSSFYPRDIKYVRRQANRKKVTLFTLDECMDGQGGETTF